jgi:hypothetical protein
MQPSIYHRGLMVGKTPNIDRIGNEGGIFMHYYAMQSCTSGRNAYLEAYAGASIYPNHGERVVRGTRLMQSASDPFLGWTEGRGGRHFYIRQLRDMKTKILVELFEPTTMIQYAEVCGYTLARAHARSGDSALISGYLGKSDTFDRAVAAFSIAYADQSEQDHAVLMKAVRRGDLEVETEPD